MHQSFKYLHEHDHVNTRDIKPKIRSGYFFCKKVVENILSNIFLQFKTLRPSAFILHIKYS